MEEMDTIHEINIEAKAENLEKVLGFADRILEEQECPKKEQMQLNIAIEEIFVNIASYAYPSGEGMAKIQIQITREPFMVTITFTDQGIPYDPLKKDDPDITLSAEERGIGGLGIYMVKKSMDDMHYEYSDGRNILTIQKYFQP